MDACLNIAKDQLPHYLVIDNFLEQFDELQMYAQGAKYSAAVNPVDRVSYPNIHPRVPARFYNEVGQKLANIFQNELEIHTMFMRLTTEGAPVPHQSHTDAVMGNFSFMLYLTPLEFCIGGDAGTAFLQHKATGMQFNPRTSEELAAWAADMNDGDAWEVIDRCEMMPNRACIFDSRMFHRADPVGGFGRDAADGRLVLTAFFS